MNEPLSSHNPFATRYVRPGAVAFVFRSGDDAPGVVARLAEAGWWGQILGPHGSGKSTLLAALVPAVEQAGRRVTLVALHDGQRRLPDGWKSLEPADGSTLIIVDGYEQLGVWSQRRLKQFCRRHGCGLLVTAHADVGLPTLATTTPDLATAQRVVGALLGSGDTTIGPTDVERAFDTRDGNLREALFDLYDLYESRRPRTAG